MAGEQILKAQASSLIIGAIHDIIPNIDAKEHSCHDAKWLTFRVAGSIDAKKDYEIWWKTFMGIIEILSNRHIPWGIGHNTPQIGISVETVHS